MKGGSVDPCVLPFKKSFASEKGTRGPSRNKRSTNSTAQGGSGSFKNRKPIGEIGRGG